MSPEPSGADRRRVMRFTPEGARVTAHRTGTLAGLLGGGKENLGGEVLDVSPMGLRWASTRKVELGVRLRIEIAYKDCKPFAAHAIVRWAHAQGTGYVVGIEFDRLDDGQLERLEEIQHAAMKPPTAPPSGQ